MRALYRVGMPRSPVALIEFPADDAERARRRRIAATPARAMHGVLVELERRYGGVREYLLAAGASEDDLARARARLVA